MKFLTWKVYGSILIAAVFLFAWSTRVEAAAPAGNARIIIPPKATVTRIYPIASVPLGQRFDVTAVLTTAKGEPVPDNTVNFLIGGIFMGQSRTNGQGQATITITTELPAGKHTLKAIFQGSRLFEASSETLEFSVLTAEVTVQAIPPVEGYPFRLGGQIFTSGKDGVAKIEVDRVGTYTLEVLSWRRLARICGPSLTAGLMMSSCRTVTSWSRWTSRSRSGCR